MSSDETDDERGPHGVKRVRRVARVWLSEAISSMWEQIKSYYHDREGPAQGNKAFGRNFVPRSSSSSEAIQFLPRNYYNSLWWVSLISVDRNNLKPGDEVALPDLTAYVASQFNFSLPLTTITISLQNTLRNVTLAG
jgi:hypothetical protein